MGIPAYFSTIIKRYPTIIKKYKTATVVNQLFVDCNSIIYDSFNKLSVSHDLYSHTTFENELINNVIEQLDYYIKTIGGTDLNYLAFDGVAPVAKMEQQRINFIFKYIPHSRSVFKFRRSPTSIRLLK